MHRTLKLLFLLLGLGLCAALFSQVHPADLWRTLRPLGAWAPLLLAPYFLVYLFDTLGWRAAFGASSPSLPGFLRLFSIRWAAEAVNNLIPSGYLGGEAVKIYLLRKRRVSGWTATEGVVIGKAIQILAQVLFIALGASLGSLQLPAGSSLRQAMVAVSLLAGVAFLVLSAFLTYGFFRSLRWTTRLSRRLHHWFERHADPLHQVDQQIRSFHRREPRAFLLSLASFFAGWLCDSLELWLVSHLLGWPLDLPSALAIESFIGVAKALGTFIPASLGVQESGVVLLFRGFGLTATDALAYALLRRLREGIYALVGLGLLWSEESSFRRLHDKLQQDASNQP